MKELEIEFKNLLSEADYNMLYEAYFKDSDVIRQTNYYIDTESLSLRKNTLLLRVRSKNGAQEMTLKVPNARGVMEFHGEIDIDLAEGVKVDAGDIPEIILDELAAHQIDVTDVYIFGALTTYRREVPYQDGILTLDKNEFLDAVDHELEYEVADYDRGETHFFNLLEEFDIIRQTEMTKSERFYNRLYTIKDEEPHA